MKKIKIISEIGINHNGDLNLAKKMILDGDEEDGSFNLLRVYRGIPKNKALIKFLSEEGVKQLLQKTENEYMADNNRKMPEVDEAMYFVIEEKNNQIELTEKATNEYLAAGLSQLDEQDKKKIEATNGLIGIIGAGNFTKMTM